MMRLVLMPVALGSDYMMNLSAQLYKAINCIFSEREGFIANVYYELMILNNRTNQNINMRQNKSISFLQQKRQWHHVIAPLVKFRRDTTNMGYPLDFFIHLQKLVTSGYDLRLNIPKTLCGVHDNCLSTVFDFDSEIGKVVFKANLSKLKFESQIDKINKQQIFQMKQTKYEGLQELFSNPQDLLNSKSHWLPFVIVKQKNFNKQKQTQLSTFILNNYQITKLPNIQINQVYQDYIFTKPPAASTTRFFYYPLQKQQSIKSISKAFKIDNYEPFIKRKMTKTLWKVKQDSKYSCGFFKIMYQNKSFYEQTINLVRALQHSTKRKVSKIVTDWVLDNSNRYFLIDVKEVQLSNEKPINKIQRSLTQLLEIVSCSMCLQSFQKSQITKTLTNNLLWSFMQHLQKRGDKLSFKINYKYSCQNYRVCDLCYNTVVTQSKLIQMQALMAVATNTIKSLSSIKSISNKPHYKSHYEQQTVDIQKLQMHQWRLFFYLEEIKALSNLLGQRASKDNFVYVSMKVHNSITTFKLTFDNADILPIKAIKVEYLFSIKDKIQEFFTKTQIRIRISQKPIWDSPIAEGCMYGIYDEAQTCTISMLSQRRYKQILIFNNNSQYCVLGMYIGIHNDGIKKVCSLGLDKIHDILKPKNQYSDCLSLPAEWMEIIDPNYSYKNIEGGKYQMQNNLIRKNKVKSSYKAKLPEIPSNNKKLLRL